MSTIPADDPKRKLAHVGVDAPQKPCHLALVGDVYSILLSGKDTDGRYTLIDMRVPPGGGPPPHRHNFEEMFAILEGEIEFTFRGHKSIAHAGDAVNIPANAPHNFRNVSKNPARMFCMCTPAGQDEYFLEVGDRLADAHAAPPALNPLEQTKRQAKAKALAEKYQTEFLV